MGNPHVLDLFGDAAVPLRTGLAEGAVVLHGFALEAAAMLLAGVAQVSSAAPFRHMKTPGGHQMSVAMTNCGNAGWVTDARGYRYAGADPVSGAPWPAMPDGFAEFARYAATTGGFDAFDSDACLVNRYEPGARMTLHQDKDEIDFEQPIVSVSLGLPARFAFGGLKRTDPLRRVTLAHGDVVVWGGCSRLAFHGVDALKPGAHPITGEYRYNLTFRRAR